MSGDLREPRISDKHFIDRITSEYGCDHSSHAFNSIYLWRGAMELSLLQGNDFFSVKCGQRGNNAWFFPCGAEEECTGFIREHLNEPNFELCYMDKGGVEMLRKYFPNQFEIARDEGSDEYIYDIAGHIGLSGKDYANARKQYNRIVKNHAARTEAISSENISKVYEILKAWQDKSGADFNIYESERDMLEHRTELGVSGILVYLDGEPYGTMCDYKLSDDTYDLAIAKEKKHISGGGYYIKRELFLRLFGTYPYANGEEDLGIPGLREMKNHLHPIKKVEMWKAKARV